MITYGPKYILTLSMKTFSAMVFGLEESIDFRDIC